jgi:hypothetical protein
LAEGPAKLIKNSGGIFEQNSNSAGMQELPSTELHQNRIRGMCKVPNNVQIERRCLLTLDLDVVNKHTMSSSTTTIHDAHPPSPPCYVHFIATATPSSPSTTPASLHIRHPQPAQHERCGNATSPNERAPATSTMNSLFVAFIHATRSESTPPCSVY